MMKKKKNPTDTPAYFGVGYRLPVSNQSISSLYC